MTSSPHTSFAQLLDTVLTEPGQIHAAYTAFHGYSLGNQMRAMVQCHHRGIPFGPMATFPRWKELGRFVRKGEKAIELWMPVTVKRRESDDDEPETLTRFVLRRHWFVLSQTDGQDVTPPVIEGWDVARAMGGLDIREVPFDHVDGNVQGVARGRSIAVSPVAGSPFKTRVHELAHVVLGHTTEGELNDDDCTPKSLREVEAESVAMLVCAALQQPGVEYARGYVQHWLQGETIPERSAQRIFKAADQILRAGRERHLLEG
jgi:hypothetical protein